MSEVLDMAHDMAKDLEAVGAMDAMTMRTMDDLCLPAKRSFTAVDVRRIRGRTRMSQPIFAVMVGVGANTVAQWERGAKKLGGPSARDLIDREGIGAIA